MTFPILGMNLLQNLAKNLGRDARSICRGPAKASRHMAEQPLNAGRLDRRGIRKAPMHVLAASTAATLLALFASEALHGGGGVPFDGGLLMSSAAAQSSGPSPAQTQVAMMATAREEIPNAYLSALQRTPVVAPPAQTSADLPDADMRSTAIRRISSDELALLMKRAMSLLASGDIPPARLLLERAADAQEASAAFLLAQTYDPAILGTSDIRTITPDPVAALAWYRKAAQLGSVDAQRRIPQIVK